MSLSCDVCSCLLSSAPAPLCPTCLRASIEEKTAVRAQLRESNSIWLKQLEVPVAGHFRSQADEFSQRDAQWDQNSVLHSRASTGLLVLAREQIRLAHAQRMLTIRKAQLQEAREALQRRRETVTAEHQALQKTLRYHVDRLYEDLAAQRIKLVKTGLGSLVDIDECQGDFALWGLTLRSDRAACLGYLAHVLCIIVRYLDIPIPCEIFCCGSTTRLRAPGAKEWDCVDTPNGERLLGGVLQHLCQLHREPVPQCLVERLCILLSSPCLGWHDSKPPSSVARTNPHIRRSIRPSLPLPHVVAGPADPDPDDWEFVSHELAR